MNRSQIIEKVRSLHLPERSYVLFGSCPLAAVGLREASDIDMLVDDEVYNMLKRAGWPTIEKSDNDRALMYDVFDVHTTWNFGVYNPTLEHLLQTAVIIDGVPFVSLDELRKWKVALGRAKDERDVALIDDYRQKTNSPLQTA